MKSKPNPNRQSTHSNLKANLLMTLLVLGVPIGTKLVLNSAWAEPAVSPRIEPAGTLNVPRTEHSAARLSDGRVVIWGGRDTNGFAAQPAEIYDPQTRIWSLYTDPTPAPVPLLDAGPDYATAIELANTFALFFGANGAGLLPSGSPTVTTIDVPELRRDAATATELMHEVRDADGNITEIAEYNKKILVAGGHRPVPNAQNGEVEIYPDAVLYNPAEAQTDKNDYQPGDQVLLSGSGWKPGEWVDIYVVDDAVTNPEWYYDTSVQADDSGNFLVEPYLFEVLLEHLGVTFDLTALGTDSGLNAKVQFTDDAIVKTYEDSARTIFRDAFAWGTTNYVKVTGAFDRRCYRIQYFDPNGTLVQDDESPNGGGTQRTTSFLKIPASGPSGMWTVKVFQGNVLDTCATTFTEVDSRIFDVARAVIIGAGSPDKDAADADTVGGDNDVREQEPTTVQHDSGTQTIMHVRSDDLAGIGADNNERIFLRFDLSSFPSVTVANARLRLNMVNAPVAATGTTPSRTYNLQAVSNTWAEGTITWNNQPDVFPSISASNTNVRGPIERYIYWTNAPLASDVGKFIATPSTNHGWRISDSVEDADSRLGTFDTTEANLEDNKIRRPVLLFDYTDCTTPSAPSLNSPICAGATSVSGTSSEASGTTIEVFVNSSSVGTTTVSGGTWTKSSLSPLSAGQVVTAKATVSGGCQSGVSGGVTVQAVSTTPTVNSPICVGATSVSGTSTEAAGTSIEVFVNGVSAGTTTVSMGAWTKTVAALVAGDVVKAKATASGECQSEESAGVTVATSAAPTVNSPICVGATSVSGTSAEAAGTSIEVFVNGVSAGTTTVSMGAWTKTVAALVAGDVVKAKATASGECQSAESAGVTVATSAAPAVNSPICVGATSVSGTSTEAAGTSIEVFVNGVSAGTTTVSMGAWTKTVAALVAGDVVKAKATASGKCQSAESAGVTVATSAAPTVNSPICVGATSVSGTSAEAAGTSIEVFVNGVSAGTTTVSMGAWTKTVAALVAGDVVKAKATASGECQSAESAGVTVATSAAPALNSPICVGATSVSGTSTEAAGTSIEVFVNGVSAGTTTVSMGAWTKTVAALVAGDVVKAKATASSECQSAESAGVTVATSAAPTVNSPICVGATSVSGTSAEAAGTSIEVFVNGVSAGTTTVSMGAWTKTVAALVAGDVVKAKATASGECQSAESAGVTVATSAAPTVNSPICVGATSVSGTSAEAAGTSIEVFVNGVSAGTTTVSTGAWTKTVAALVAGDVVTAKATAYGKCQSAALTGVAVRANSAAPVVSSPICAGATSVSGTSTEAAGTSIEVFVNAVSAGTTTVSMGAWTKTVAALVAGDVVTAKATAYGKCQSAALTGVAVRANSAAPVVSSPICAGATSVSGTSTEAAGTSIEVFVNGVSAGTTTVSMGAWTKTVAALVASDVVKAKATASGKCQSAESAGVTINAPPTITLGTSPSVTYGTTSASLPYTATGSPDEYSIDFDLAANTAGFVDVSLTLLPATPISITMPTSPAAGVGVYNGKIKVKNTTTGCISSEKSFTITVTPRDALVNYIGQTIFVTSGTSATTAQVTLSASMQDPTGSALVGATVDFIDMGQSPPKVLASGIKVTPVANSSSGTGTANTIVTLSSGQYGAESYLILVEVTGNYNNNAQATADKTATVVVSKLVAPSQIIGGGTFAPFSAAAGTYKGDATEDVTYCTGLSYTKTGTNPKGKYSVTVPQADGSVIFIKSTSISSISVTSGTGTIKYATVYAKGNISRIQNDVVTAIDGNITVRMDVVDYNNASPNEIGFTVLSSKDSKLYYSNRWVLENNAWQTKPEAIKTGTLEIGN